MPRRYKMHSTRKVARPVPDRLLRRPEPLPHTIRPEYPSRVPTVDCTQKRTAKKVPGVTVAPAYNKGAYQVIPESDIKHIGK